MSSPVVTIFTTSEDDVPRVSDTPGTVSATGASALPVQSVVVDVDVAALDANQAVPDVVAPVARSGTLPTVKVALGAVVSAGMSLRAVELPASGWVPVLCR